MFVIIWVVVYNESWKRTSARIQSLWHTNEFKEGLMERPQYNYVASFDIKSKSIQK